jgi:hypothetical protein
MAKVDLTSFFTGKTGLHSKHYGPTGGEYDARDRELTPGAWKRVAALAAKDHKVPVADVVLLWAHEFPKPYADGSIGEVNVRYGPRYEAIYGLYADGHISCWMD